MAHIHLIKESKSRGSVSEINDCLQFYLRQVNLVSLTKEIHTSESLQTELQSIRKECKLLKELFSEL